MDREGEAGKGRRLRLDVRLSENTPLPMLVRHAGRPMEDGWMDGCPGSDCGYGDGGERKQSVMRAGAGERVRFKGNLFLALRGNEDEEEDTGRSHYLL